MRIHSPRNRGATGRIVLLVTAIVAIVVGALLTTVMSGSDGSVSADSALATVRRGPLTISVTESGTIKARENLIIKSEVEGTTTIIYLIAEGTRVKTGELLIQLDASELEDSKVDQKIRVQNAAAAHIRASENLAVARSQAKSDIAKAQLDYKFAKEDLNQYVEGKYPKLLNESKSRITLAEEKVRLAANTLEWSRKLHAEKYLSKNELERDELAQTRANLDLELAIASRDLLADYTYKRRLAELRSEIDQTEMAMGRVERKAKADKIQAEADLKAKQSASRQQKKKLVKIEEQIAKATITAPINGMVVYATSAQANWRGNVEPLSEGQNVHERQELIHLPTADAIMAEIKIHESSLEKVALGMLVRIAVDALSGRVFWGKVARIAPLPDAVSRWMNPDRKVFSAHIHIDGKGEGLRTGMSCQTQIIIKQFNDATYVPIQSVVRVGDIPTVWLANGNRTNARSVQIGMDNNQWVHVLSGLDEGEKVLLAPPLSTGGMGERQESTPFISSPTQRPKIQSSTTERDAKQSANDNAGAKPQRRRFEHEKERRKSSDPEAKTQGRRIRISDEQSQSMKRHFENMTDEEKTQMRKRFESMSQEERVEAMKNFTNQ